MKHYIKKYFMILTILPIIASTVLGEESMTKNELIIDNSKTEKVILFLRGAQIKKKSSVDLKQGETTLIFIKLSSSINPESIQVETTGSHEIISIDHKINYLDTPTNSERIESLQKELEKTENELQIVEIESNILLNEQDVLTANKEFNKNSTLKLDEFKAFNDFFKKRTKEISYKQLELSKKKEELEYEYNALENELTGYQTKRHAVSEITVQMFSSKDEENEIELNYYISNAGWKPFYDIRVEPDSDKATINLKAELSQHTGEDWENVDLILSTSNPNIGMNEPRLYPWRLEFYNNTPIPSVRASKSKRKSEPMMEMSMDEEMLDMDDMEYSIAPPPSVASDNQTALEFVLNGKVNIPTSLSKSIDVANYKLDMKLKHYSVRKLDMDVFLLATLTGWENMNLLAGNANIFLSGAFVGRGYINPNTINDNLEVSLGRDKQVIVNRTKNTDFKSKTTFGSNIKETRSFDITVRNLKNKPINIEIIDQVPLSTDSSIVVNVDKDDISSAVFDEETGQLTWNIAMEGGSSETKKFKYTVTYPSKNTVILE